MVVRTLSLCSGIGGLDLGVHLAIPEARAVGYVEREAFAAATLVARMESAHLDLAPIWDDLASFPSFAFRGGVDLVVAGFPCQPVSVAGKRRAQEDERWLWPHITRIVRDVEPELVFLENVPGLLSAGALDVLGDLASLGFDAEWSTLRASDVGASHRRRRLFVLAYRSSERLQRCLERSVEAPACVGWRGGLGKPEGIERGSRPRLEENGQEPEAPNGALADTGRSALREQSGWSSGPCGPDSIFARRARANVAHANGKGRGIERMCAPDDRVGPTFGNHADGRSTFPPGPNGEWSTIHSSLWPVEAPQRGVRLLDDGTPSRMDQLRALGNAVVPQQAAAALEGLIRRATA